MRNTSVFKEAREIARHCIFPKNRDVLRARIDECKEVFDRFNISASRLDMENLVAAWTRLLVAMDAAPPYVQPTPPIGGKCPVPVEYGAREAA